MIPFDDQHQAHEILNTVIGSEEMGTFISQCLNSPGVDTALYSIFAANDYQRELLIAEGRYDDRERSHMWHKALLTAFAVGVTISRSFTKLENTFWAEEEGEGTV